MMIIVTHNVIRNFQGYTFELLLKVTLNLCHICKIGNEIVNWGNKFGASIESLDVEASIIRVA